MVKLTIMNETGHTEMVASAAEVIEQITDHPTHWVFVDGEMVTRETVDTVNWESVENVTLAPAVKPYNQE